MFLIGGGGGGTIILSNCMYLELVTFARLTEYSRATSI